MSRSLVIAFVGLAALGVVGVVCPLCRAGARPVAAQERADTAVARLSVSGMTCATCPLTARLALQRLAGVYSAAVSYDSASAVVRYDPRRVNPTQIVRHLERLTGYRATLLAAGSAAGPRPRSR
jgi:mercuric ion binding protein